MRGARTRLVCIELRHDGCRHLLGGILDGEPVGAHFIPLEQRQAVGSKKTPDTRGVPAENFFEHGDQNAHGVVADDGALGHTGDELGFGDGDGKAVVLIDVHHNGQIGAAVTHVDDLVVANADVRAEFLKHGDFAPAGGGANDGIHLDGGFVVAEARAEDVIRRNDAFERRLDDFLRRGGDHVEMEFVAFDEIIERARKEPDVVLQADAFAGFREVLAAHAAEIRVVENEIAELRALLHEVHLREAVDLVAESVETDELAKNHARVVEAERLVKIAGQQNLFTHVLVLLLVPFLVGLPWEASRPPLEYTLTSFPHDCPTNYFDPCYALKMCTIHYTSVRC